MTSSMLSGERRWASSSRRGGMTVLGKVAVPKPINLPSQRLEKHGLDPNVEIVPKGTLSWGSRSSSSASNAWGSSSLSPNTDGGASSPSHLSARPSSGGSGTRPSTASSDRALESCTNAWGSSSRPSSASGPLTSNQTSLASLRPRSAETRPGSSQLSRFAEPSTDNSGAWSGARTAEKLGVSQPKSDGFSLSSGDFPTLGSEKDKSALNSELQDDSSHGRPSSSSGPQKEKSEASIVADVPVNENMKGGVIDSWRRDHQSHGEDDMRPGIEKWQGNTQPYPNASVPPQHYDAWHGPPVNNPQNGVWFRGPAGGPPFGNPVTPGGFPIEPFPYYRPGIPPTGLVNSPPVPPPGNGPRGHPKNGDVFRPHMPDAYIRPGIPMRPGYFHGPMAFEGYYGPPMGYYNSNERDVPFMGMAAGPPVHNRYPNQNPPEPANSQGKPGGYGIAGKPLASEQVESSHPPETAVPYRVLLKQHESDGKNERVNWEDSETTNASYIDRRDRPRIAVWENEQRSNYRKNEMDLRKSAHGEEPPSQALENQVSSSSVTLKAKFPDSSGNIKKPGDISPRKLDCGNAASGVLETPPRSSAPKDASLIKKIEGLNAKARDNSSARNRDEQRNKFHANSASVNNVKEAGAGGMFPARAPATDVINPPHHEVNASGGEKNFDSLSASGPTSSRQIARGMQSRGDHRNKGKTSNEDVDGWRKKPEVADISALSGAQLEATNLLIGDHQISVESYDRSGSYNPVRRDGESVQTRSEPIDSHDQRAKMKELAKQRTKQLQEEEEERIRKQKAKALAKLDELNRRSQAVEGPTSKESATTSDIPNKQQELQPSDSAIVSGKFGVVSSALNSDAKAIPHINDISINKVEKLPILSSEPPSETHVNSGKEAVLIHNLSMNLQQDVNSADGMNALQFRNNITSKQKRTSYKQKQNLPSEKTGSEKVASSTSFGSKAENDLVVDISVSSGNVIHEVGSTGGLNMPMNSATMVDSSVNQRKKNTRNGKNKQKFEDSSSALPLAPKEANISKSSVEIDKAKVANIELEQGPVQPSSLSKDSTQFSEHHRHSASEEAHAKMNSQWKPQHSRRPSRNMQATRPAEKSHGSDAVMWAPVKHHNKTDVDESDEKTKAEAVNTEKSDQQVHNFKNKRAEMERYVPKPVAKEMAQQGSIQQQVVSSVNQAPADGNVGRVDSVSVGPQIAQVTDSIVGKVTHGMEPKNRDGRHAKQGKAHGSWRQRNQMETTNVHDVRGGLDIDSNSEPIVQGQTEDRGDPKSEINLSKGQSMQINNYSDLDGSNNPVNHDSAAHVSLPVIKDHGATGRGRRVPFRGHKGGGMNHDVDHKKNDGELERNETPTSSSEPSQPDIGAAALKENRNVGERLTSHWQPKSQASNNQRGNKSSDLNVGSVVVGVNKKDPCCDEESIPAADDKMSNAHVAQPHNDQSVLDKSKARETTHFGNQDSKRERKHVPTRRHPNSSNQGNVNLVEQSPTSIDQRHDHRPFSGFGKNGNLNRFGRGHEPRGDWKPPAQDNRHYNQSTNRERQGPNLHYEYHPVGPYDGSKSDNIERPKDGNHAGGRFRDRGQPHSRRGGGNFYGRQAGAD
ncbi:hypothetical protein AAHE18_11G140500 [Arachis hypogaea]